MFLTCSGILENTSHVYIFFLNYILASLWNSGHKIKQKWKQEKELH